MTIKIAMFSKADTVEGQGVGSAYKELIQMLKNRFPTEFEITINNFKKSDISHYHTINPSFFISTFQKKKRGVKVGYVHFIPETLDGSLKLVGPAKWVFKKYLLAFYNRMDVLVVVNSDFIKKLVALGFDESKIVYIPNFVNTEGFYQIEDQQKIQAIKQTLKIDAQKFAVLGVGQIQKRKGVDDFYQLALKNPDIQFIWAGGFSFGKITEGYEGYKQIVDNPPANLLFTGIVDRFELVKYYNISDVFLLPSYSELFPMSILEAFNCGTPVMLRDLTLYEDILGDSYIKATDGEEMHRMLQELTLSPELIQTYQKKSLEAAEKYSEENISKTWLHFYQDLVSDRFSQEII